MSRDESSVAVYWDFENIHASLVDGAGGTGTYRQSRFTPQEPLVDVEALMEFAASLGSVAINRAYGNWQWFSRYREILLHTAIELIQLFPPGANAKNGADIKLCLDATEDILRFPHIDRIVIIGGDSDFLPVAQKIKAAGKRLYGVGCERATNRHWAHSCHEFRYYESLLIADEATAGSPPAAAVVPAADAADLIRRAIARLSSNDGDPWVLKAAIRPMVKRLDPTFEEKAYGATTFAELLKKHADLFEVRPGQHDHEIRIRAPVADEAAPQPAAESPVP